MGVFWLILAHFLLFQKNKNQQKLVENNSNSKNKNTQRKRVKDVYMREVTESEIKTKFSKELNAYITYKHNIETKSSVGIYVNGERKIIFDKGYSIIEYSPLDEEYNVRVFIDDKGNILKYYFDVI